MSKIQDGSLSHGDSGNSRAGTLVSGWGKSVGTHCSSRKKDRGKLEYFHLGSC